MDLAQPEARGRAFLGPLRHVKEIFGRPAVDALSRGASTELQRVLSRRIRQAAWYPYSAYVELLRQIDAHHGSGDLSYCRTLGDWAGQQDLGSMFRIYAALSDPERLIRGCRLVWPQYYRNAGTMTAITSSPSDTCLRIAEFDAMDSAHCRLMEGWMISTMNQIGCRVHPGGRETACTNRGAEFHEFRCTWSRG